MKIPKSRIWLFPGVLHHLNGSIFIIEKLVVTGNSSLGFLKFRIFSDGDMVEIVPLVIEFDNRMMVLSSLRFGSHGPLPFKWTIGIISSCIVTLICSIFPIGIG